MTTVSELMKKQVVDVTNGRLLGKIRDVCVGEGGRIESFTAVRKKPLFYAGKPECSTFSWDDVANFREDVILVKRSAAVLPPEKSEPLIAGIQGYIAIALLLVSLIILIKSVTG